eukprot:GHVP01011926.1.p1 GENE.GHVP01011926.1~~GHVP01011926.1.p1  ORF type:complete len:130 (-),score=6.84 GHVP01011926.1:216-605(-)
MPSCAFEQLNMTDEQLHQLNRRLETEAALHKFMQHEAEKISFLALQPEATISQLSVFMKRTKVRLENVLRAAFEFGRTCTSGNPNALCRRALTDANYILMPQMRNQPSSRGRGRGRNRGRPDFQRGRTE